MKYCLELRARARADQSIKAKHARLVDVLSNLPSPWGMPKDKPPTPDLGGELVAHANLGKFLDRNIKGHVYYQFRRSFRDEAGDDDFIDLTFNPEKIDYYTLVTNIVPIYVEAFDAYLAMVKHDDFSDTDYDKLREIEFDARHKIYRVFPACYYDAILCQRALGLKPKQVAERLHGRVEIVQASEQGVYIVIKSTPMDFSTADETSRKLRQLLGA